MWIARKCLTSVIVSFTIVPFVWLVYVTFKKSNNYVKLNEKLKYKVNLIQNCINESKDISIERIICVYLVFY